MNEKQLLEIEDMLERSGWPELKWRDPITGSTFDAETAAQVHEARTTVAGSLRVWWIPQVPMKPFLVAVGNLREAKLLLDTLAKYDAFQFENRIKPDYCNTGGLSVFEDGEWCDWADEEGNDIDETKLT